MKLEAQGSFDSACRFANKSACSAQDDIALVGCLDPRAAKLAHHDVDQLAGNDDHFHHLLAGGKG
ncbi:MAG: hypothetical protein ACM34G_01745, partial [Acidobacteriota bacterium]